VSSLFVDNTHFPCTGWELLKKVSNQGNWNKIDLGSVVAAQSCSSIIIFEEWLGEITSCSYTDM